MKSLAKNTAMVGGTEFLLLFTNIIRNKYVAVNIGAEGYGILSLLTSFFQYANIIAGSWLSTASLKYISEYNSEGKQEEVKVLFNLTLYLVVISATIVGGVFIIFFPAFQKNFLSDDVLFTYYVLFAASFWGTSITNVFRILLQSMMDMKSIVRIRIISQVFNIVSVVVLVYLFDLLGLFINIAVVALFITLMYFLVVKKKIKIQKFDFKWYKSDMAKKVFSFSAADIFSGFIDQTAEYLKRILIIDFLSMASLGLFAASRGILKVANIINTSSMFHFKPQMSQTLTSSQRSSALNDYFRLMLIMGGMTSIPIILFSHEIIRILYSKDFDGLTPVLFIFVLAQYLGTIQLGYMFSVVGMAKLKTHTLSIFVSTPFAVIVPYFLLDQLGLIAVGLGAITTGAIRILIYGTYLGWSHKVYMKRSNLLLLILGVAMIFAARYSLIFSIYIRIPLVFVMGAIFYLLLSKEEKKQLFSTIRKKIFRKK